MERDNLDHDGPDELLLDDRGPEPRTTAFEGPTCEQCGHPLTGRKQRFCSDRCRMAVRRQVQVARIDALLSTIEASVAALRGELEGRNEAS